MTKETVSSDGLVELDRWLRYEFLTRQRDGAQWRCKPPAVVAQHYLQTLNECISRMEDQCDEDSYDP